MAPKIFIDGEHGTTGLQIRQRLQHRDDIELLAIAHENRHNKDIRADLLKAADIAILCLPDAGARGIGRACRRFAYAVHRRFNSPSD